MAASPESTASPLDRHTSPVAGTARKDGRATGSLICGILSIPALLFWPVALILAVVAIVLGVIARNSTRANGLAGHGQATAGMILGIITIALFVILISIGIAMLGH